MGRNERSKRLCRSFIPTAKDLMRPSPHHHRLSRTAGRHVALAGALLVLVGCVGDFGRIPRSMVRYDMHDWSGRPP
jgi:hypothetical protein